MTDPSREADTRWPSLQQREEGREEEVELGQEEKTGAQEAREARTEQEEEKGSEEVKVEGMQQEVELSQEEEMKEGVGRGRQEQEMEETRRRPQYAEDTRRGSS